jgi:hypothetical protein
MAQDKLALAIRTNERTRVAVDAQDRGRYLGPRLLDDQAPRLSPLGLL